MSKPLFAPFYCLLKKYLILSAQESFYYPNKSGLFIVFLRKLLFLLYFSLVRVCMVYIYIFFFSPWHILYWIEVRNSFMELEKQRPLLLEHVIFLHHVIFFGVHTDPTLPLSPCSPPLLFPPFSSFSMMHYFVDL